MANCEYHNQMVTGELGAILVSSLHTTNPWDSPGFFSKAWHRKKGAKMSDNQQSTYVYYIYIYIYHILL